MDLVSLFSEHPLFFVFFVTSFSPFKDALIGVGELAKPLETWLMQVPSIVDALEITWEWPLASLGSSLLPSSLFTHVDRINSRRLQVQQQKEKRQRDISLRYEEALQRVTVPFPFIFAFLLFPQNLPSAARARERN